MIELKECVEILDSKRIPLSSSERKRLKKIYPYYGAQGIIDYVENYIFDGEYILIAEDGNNLKSLQQNIATWVEGKFWVNNHAYILGKKKGYNLRYIYYLLSILDLRGYITGSAQPKLNQENLAGIQLQLPNINRQNKVAQILSCIDNKIEINNKINSELEVMAKIIYDYWFLQFEFPNEEGKPYKASGGKMVWNGALKREIPEEWKSGYLEEMIEVCSGRDHQNLGVGKIPVYGSGGILRYVNKNLYHGESVLIPRKGTLNNVIYVDEQFWTVDTMFYTKMKKRDSALFVYYTVKLFDFEKLNTGTGVPSMTSSIIYSLKTIIPDENILEAFNSKAYPLYKQIQHNKKENQELTSLRDFLLPLLMNGQVSFKE